MNTTKHTAEPWKIERDLSGVAYVYAGGQFVADLKEGAAEANAARIVACVNACAGMEDPADSIASARAVLKALLDLISDLGGVDDLSERSRKLHAAGVKALRALGG